MPWAAPRGAYGSGSARRRLSYCAMSALPSTPISSLHQTGSYPTYLLKQPVFHNPDTDCLLHLAGLVAHALRWREEPGAGVDSGAMSDDLCRLGPRPEPEGIQARFKGGGQTINSQRIRPRT